MKSFMKIYTQRKSEPKKQLLYHFDKPVRSRLLTVLNGLVTGSFSDFLSQLGFEIMKVYGFMEHASYEAAKTSEDPSIEHFFRCDNDQVLDFLELAFRQSKYSGGQEGVDLINSVLENSAIGYRFSTYHQKKSFGIFGRTHLSESRFPEAYRITDEQVHQLIVKPTLQFLSRPELSISNDELMKALAACRQKETEDAITLAGSAYESFLKTVLKIKKCSFDPDKDTCSSLVKLIIKNGLLPSFYESCFISPATIRNKLGDAHGRGPEKRHEPNTNQANHMINLVSSNILFLRKMIEL